MINPRDYGQKSLKGAKKVITSTIEVSTVRLSAGEYIQIWGGDNLIEVSYHPDGVAIVCVHDKDIVHTFHEVYGR